MLKPCKLFVELTTVLLIGCAHNPTKHLLGGDKAVRRKDVGDSLKLDMNIRDCLVLYKRTSQFFFNLFVVQTSLVNTATHTRASILQGEDVLAHLHNILIRLALAGCKTFCGDKKTVRTKPCIVQLVLDPNSTLPNARLEVTQGHFIRRLHNVIKKGRLCIGLILRRQKSIKHSDSDHIRVVDASRPHDIIQEARHVAQLLPFRHKYTALAVCCPKCGFKLLHSGRAYPAPTHSKISIQPRCIVKHGYEVVVV